MVSDSDVSSGRVPARSPFVSAFYGALAALVVAGVAAYFLWPSPDAAAGAPAGGAPADMGFGPSPVEVVAAVETLAAEPVSLIGEVAPLREAVVASEVEGRVAELLVDEGDEVRAGNVLARLDTTTAELDLDASRAQRAEAQARLVRFESEVRRMSDLRERGAVSEREYELAIADRDAQSQMVTRITSEAARLEELIERAEIRAPFGGQVAEVHAEIGEWSARGGDVVTLVDLSEVEVTVNAPERYVAEVDQARREGVSVPVRFDAINEEFAGTVKAIIPRANSQARTFPVVVVVANPEGRIRAGMSARVLAQVGDPVPTVLVPKDALVLRSGRTFVFRIVPMQASGAAGGGGPGGDAAAAGDDAGENPDASDGDAGGGAGAGHGQGTPSGVQELEVEIGLGYGNWQVVRGAVQGGDQVVVRGNENLQPGMPVTVTATAAIEPPPTSGGDVPSVQRSGGGR